MTDRYDAVTARENNGKTYYTRIGSAFPNRNGSGFTVVLDAVPASVDGQYRILLFEPKPREDRHDNRQQQTGNGGNASRGQYDDRRGGFGDGGYGADDLNDSVPFISINGVW